MARFGDCGPYHPDNVYCATVVENSKAITPERRRGIGKPSKPVLEAYGADRRRAAASQAWAEERAAGVRRRHRRRGEAENARAIRTPSGRFPSAKDAAAHHNIAPSTAAR